MGVTAKTRPRLYPIQSFSLMPFWGYLCVCGGGCRKKCTKPPFGLKKGPLTCGYVKILSYCFRDTFVPFVPRFRAGTKVARKLYESSTKILFRVHIRNGTKVARNYRWVIHRAYSHDFIWFGLKI